MTYNAKYENVLEDKIIFKKKHPEFLQCCVEGKISFSMEPDFDRPAMTSCM